MVMPSQRLRDHSVEPSSDGLDCNICSETVVQHPNGFTGWVHERTMTKRWFAGPIDTMQLYVDANKHEVNLLYTGDATQGPKRYAVCSKCGLNVHYERKEGVLGGRWVHGPELAEKYDARNEPHAQKVEQANPYITVSDVTNDGSLSAMRYTGRRDNLRFESSDGTRYVLADATALTERDAVIKRQAEQVVAMAADRQKLQEDRDKIMQELQVMRGEIKPPWDEGSETGQDAQSDDEPFMQAIYEPRYSLIEVIRATRDGLL